MGAAAAGLALAMLPPAQQLIGAIVMVTAALLLQYNLQRNTTLTQEANHD